MENTAFEGTGISKKWLVIILLGTLALAGICLLAIVLLSPDDGRNRSAAGSTPAKATLGEPLPTWEEVRSLPELRLSFEPTNSVNVPVKQELEVDIAKEDLEKIPQTIKVYEMLPMFQSEKELKKTAAAFGMSGEVEYMTLRKDSLSFWYQPFQDMLYVRDKKIAEFQEVPEVPSERECKEIAWKMAEEKGLLCPEAEIIATNQTDMASDSTGNKLVPLLRHVIIGRSLDGYDVRGPGMQLRIMLGDKGRLAYLYDCLRPLRLVGNYSIKPLEQALREAQVGTGSMNLQIDAHNPTVKNLDIFYYAQGPLREARALLPVYAFMGHDCCIYVPAFGERIE